MRKHHHIRTITRSLVIALGAGLITAVTVTPAAAVGGPSVALPTIPSVPVTSPVQAARPTDQASANALSGNQPVGGTVADGGGRATATPLSVSASWSVAAQSGDFTWSYPLPVPQVPGGLTPGLALSYRSSAVDGLTSATNNQPGWVGDGWDLGVGFIERRYGACANDTMGGTTPPQTGDLCWRSDNGVSSNGGAMVKVDNTAFRFQNDDDSRIERKFDVVNGDNDNEYWKVTAVDGTQYFYGSRPASNSTWTVPVFGDDVGEPCHQSTFAASSCAQAWRWNLDKVVDPHGNVIVYTYAKETNSYGRNLQNTAVAYDRGGYLTQADYGLRDDLPGPALGVVKFEVADRCVAGSDCVASKPENWPDVPWTNKCDTATCAGKHSPTFWTTKRLNRVLTQSWNGTAPSDVDSWTLAQSFPDPGDLEKAALWLKSITHTGHAGGTAITLNPVTFEGKRLPNRVEAVDGVGPLNRYRVTGVVSEAGGLTEVVYAAPNCVSGSSMPANPETNTLRCYPAKWQKKDYAERTDHFHKYVVASVRSSDRTALNFDQRITYEYLDGAAWRYDRSEFTKDADRTWNDYRGYGRVRVHGGGEVDDPSPATMTELRYYRGMHGDKLPVGTRTVSVTDSAGLSREDSDWLAGQQYESQRHLGETETVVDKVITTPGWIGPTATRDHLKAYKVNSSAVDNYTANGAAWIKTRTEYTYDAHGQLTATNDLGDVTTATDDRCTRVEYARNETAWLVSYPTAVSTVAVNCATTPVLPDHGIGASRVFYDGLAAGVAPTKGDVTSSEVVRDWPASGPVYQTTGSATYDLYGRVKDVTDVLGKTAVTEYTPTTGGPVTQVKSTNPIGQAATLTMSGARGLTTKMKTINNLTVEYGYDALGRTTEVWLPNRPKASYSASTKYVYDIRNDRASSVTTSSIRPDGLYNVGTTLYDGHYRVRQIQAPTTGGRLLTDTRYDAQGRAYKSTQPYFNSGAVDTTLWAASEVDVPGWTKSLFDGAGRQTGSVYYKGATEAWRSTVAYEADRVHSTPPQGGTATTEIANARGQLVERREYTAPTPTGTYRSTTYGYDAAGRMNRATNTAGSNWRWTYDVRGNLVRSEDPDRGVNTMVYANTGQRLTSTDSRGTTLALEYDQYGRLTGQFQGSLAGQQLEKYTYDTALLGKGKTASATRYVNGVPAYTTQTDSYTTLGLPSKTTVTVPTSEGALAGSYSTHYTYTFDGQLAGMTYPAVPAAGVASEGMTINHDTLGRPVSSNTASTIVGWSEYTVYGELARVRLGDPGKQVWQSYYYDTNTRRLTRSILDAEVAAPMQADVTLAQDPAGNITSVTDETVGQPVDRQCFEYDHLRRMTQAWTPTGACSAPKSTAGLGGPAPYWHEYAFDTSGNRATETRRAAASTTTRTYAYQVSKPHTLDSVTTTTTSGSATDTFGYDAAGNTTARHVGTANQVLDWDVLGKLTKITDGTRVTENVYAVGGTRLLRREPDATTLYLGAQEVRLAAGASVPTVTRYYSHGGGAVAMRQGTALRWLWSDHQSSAQIAVDASTMAVTKRRQLPYGAPRGTAAPTLAGDRGFVGGVRDSESGLTLLGARQYDPDNGRFLSVDPVMDLADPQQWNPYAYANQSPITFADPSGLTRVDALGYGTPLGNGNFFGKPGPSEYSEPSLPTPSGYKPYSPPKAKPATRHSQSVGSQTVWAPSTKIWLDAFLKASEQWEPKKLHCYAPEAPEDRNGGLCLSGAHMHANRFAQAMCEQPGIECSIDLDFAALTFRMADPGMMIAPGAGGSLEELGFNRRGAKMKPGGPTDMPPMPIKPFPDGTVGNNPIPKYAMVNGVPIARSDWNTRLSRQSQEKHLEGHTRYGGKGYMKSNADAQQVLDDFHSGKAEVLGKNSSGFLAVRTDSVVGYNHNPGAGYPHQPTNVFFIKGTTKVSVVPADPTWTP
ncbi:RHS repeat-associated core domain-containing protein [Actinokineospora globicatena]|uniref:Type IV secretion protein Rhs n=1 Tax=Actinokineospora globicatena TaxID=103729 RepID=A0A9W6V823_9PSEU|nr:RHS repeat-associated core domain-containing protein [Actinokineospora globicatena]GLW89523.1 type IV secretion protein Rhs [Actinokineospora globicatena]